MPPMTHTDEEELVAAGLTAGRVILDAAGITESQLRTPEAARAVAWMALQDARFLVGLEDLLHAVRDAEVRRCPCLGAVS